LSITSKHYSAFSSIASSSTGISCSAGASSAFDIGGIEEMQKAST